MTLGTKRSTGSQAALLALAASLLVFLLTAALALAAGAPIISGTAVTEIGETSARLEAEINPNGRKTEYRFEYVDQAGFEAEGFAGATRIPIPDGSIPSGTGNVPVSEPLGNLSPGTIYHYRVVAGNTFSPPEGTIGEERAFATYASRPLFGACANEALRSVPSLGLPDCRAYEQASPVEKRGNDVTGPISFLKATPDGGAISFASNGVPGGEGTQELPVFLAGRGGGGWSTQGLLPNANAGPKAAMIGWLPDFSGVFSTATRLTKPFMTALLERSSAGGSLQEVVPYTADALYSYAGASSDGSKVLFESKTKLPTLQPAADAAIEGASNVYVWDRATGALSLAGVLNDGKAPPQGAFAGPYAWAAGTNKGSLKEGGAAGDYYTQDTHAITSDGSVYFTAAGTGQLYERVNPTAPPGAVVINGNGEEECEAAKACTIHLSNSKRTVGKGPGGTDAAGPAPAAFMAASSDGTSAFFTSSERLTNDANTGPEPEPPAIGRGEIGGGGAGVDEGFIPHAALGIAVGGEHIYWADPSRGTIGRAKLNAAGAASEINEDFIVPGPVEVEVEPGVSEEVESKPRYVAVGPCAGSGECLYWTNTGRLDGEGNPLDGGGTIGRAEIGGGNVEPAFIEGELETSPGSFEPAVSNPQGIAIGNGQIYWANDGNKHTGTKNTNTIARADLAGGSIEPEFIAAVGECPKPEEEGCTGHLSDGDLPTGLAVNSSRIYFAVNAHTGKIHSSNLNGREDKFGPSLGTEEPEGIAIDGTSLYWVTRKGGAIGRLPIGSFEPEAHACGEIVNCEPEFIKAKGSLTGVAVDSEHVYWSANGETPANPGNDLYRYQAGSGLSDLTPDSGDPNGAEVQGVLGASADGSYLYFAANGDLDGPSGPAIAGDCEGILAFATGECNLYLWQEGAPTRFIAPLHPSGGELSDAADWAPTPAGVFPSFRFQRTARVSHDGRVLLFRSREELGEYENDETPELYRYDAETEKLSCVSCNPTGSAPTGAPTLGTLVPPNLTPGQPAGLLSRNLAGEGNRVFFETTDALVGADTNGVGGCPKIGSEAQGFVACQDVYEWEAPGTGSCTEAGSAGFSAQDKGCLYLLSSGKSSYPSFFADASESGDNAFLVTREGMVGQDGDELLDVYDARELGGLAAQNQPPPTPCGSLEACHGPTGAPAAEASPGTASFSGPGNPKPKHKRPRAKRRHHRHKHHHRHHRTHAKGRTGR